MSEPCEWCGGPRGPRQKSTCSDSCRAGRWRWLNAVKRAGGADPEAPPWPESPLRGRMGEVARSNTPQVDTIIVAPPPGPRSGVNARSGTMLSYAKTRELLFQRLSHFPGGERLIDEALFEALAPTQRRKVEARDGR